MTKVVATVRKYGQTFFSFFPNLNQRFKTTLTEVVFDLQAVHAGLGDHFTRQDLLITEDGHQPARVGHDDVIGVESCDVMEGQGLDGATFCLQAFLGLQKTKKRQSERLQFSFTSRHLKSPLVHSLTVPSSFFW